MGETNRKLVGSVTIAVRWGDMDAMGHVNNTIYFRYFEEGRLAWMKAMNSIPNEGTEGFILGYASCHFRIPVVHPETLVVRTFIEKIGNSSITLFQEISSAQDGEKIYATGESRVVWVDYAAGKSVHLPEAIRNIITP